MIIKIKNLLDQSSQYSYLSAGEASGVTSLRVKNINAYQASWAVQVGKTGEEQSEIRVLGTATPSGTALTVTAATSYDHPSDTPVFATKYDKLIIKRSTSGTAGTATAVTNGTISITPDSLYTQYDDTSAVSGYAYKTSFFNSVTSEESSDSDWLTTSGPSFYSLASMRERVQRKLFSANYLNVAGGVIDDWLNEWLDEMDQAAIKVDKDYLMGTTNIAFGTSGLGTITATDFVAFKTVWVSYNGVDSFKATKKDPAEIYPNEVFNTAHPYYSWLGDRVFKVLPPSNGGTVNANYYKSTTKLTNDGDELPYVMQPYSSSFVNYALAEAYYNDSGPGSGKDTMGDRYFNRALAAKAEFTNQITPRNFTDYEMIEMTHSVFADDEGFF